MTDFQLTSPPSAQVDRRGRGEHSTVCKCPHSPWVPDMAYEKMPGELGHLFRVYTYIDKKTGKITIRRSFTSHPFFVHFHKMGGRKRGLRKGTRDLMDVLIVFLFTRASLSHSIVSSNVTKIAEALSPKDYAGKVIPETEVTASRVSRVLDLLKVFGLIEDVPTKWDHESKLFYTRVIILTDTFWQVAGAKMDKFLSERLARQLEESDGYFEPGTQAYMRAARERHIEQGRIRTNKKRRTRLAMAKCRERLAGKPVGERLMEAGKYVQRNTPALELERMDIDAFNRKCWQFLNQMKLGLGNDPPTRH
ncbi:plasmid replication initiator RepA [Candidatus Pantoea multigeneris]|uniref:Replication initiation protein n=1 Tax=Candidatus Pantoea multigeneris TaxID=2608357 RepID=A0ABX0RIJ2_9GAMM|nr:plasmid replication initiator RepA [Pantoea multigeneris]NIF23958.1 replication initiation protein [Pantoea multigeneris]